MVRPDITAIIGSSLNSSGTLAPFFSVDLVTRTLYLPAASPGRWSAMAWYEPSLSEKGPPGVLKRFVGSGGDVTVAPSSGWPLSVSVPETGTIRGQLSQPRQVR